jgi:hypothetical protein
LFQLPWEALSASNFHLTFQLADLIWSGHPGNICLFVCGPICVSTRIHVLIVQQQKWGCEHLIVSQKRTIMSWSKI